MARRIRVDMDKVRKIEKDSEELFKKLHMPDVDMDNATARGCEHYEKGDCMDDTVCPEGAYCHWLD